MRVKMILSLLMVSVVVSGVRLRGTEEDYCEKCWDECETFFHDRFCERCTDKCGTHP